MPKNILFALCIAFLTSNCFAQNPAFKVVYTHKNGNPACISFALSDNKPSPENLSTWFKNHLDANADFELKPFHSSTDAMGGTHIKYQQYYKNIPILDLVVILHLKNNLPTTLNGRFIPNFSANSLPALNENQAIEMALNSYSNTTFKWEIPSEEIQVKKIRNNANASYFPEAKLVYHCPSDSFAVSDFLLTYEMNIYAHAPMSRQMVYVDAISGLIADQIDQICSIEHTGIAHTRYHGIQAIETDSVGTDSFILFDHTRGRGILTLDVRVINTKDSIRNFSDSNNIWDNANEFFDEVATDVHWATARTFDYYKNSFDHWSYDNDTAQLVSHVHVGNKLNNAFWDGETANYGDGDGNLMMPLTSIEIIAHEITHGVTGKSSNLRYRDESGALNESFSDIFGKTIEYQYDSTNYDWYVGKKIKGAAGKPFRNLSDPNEFKHPKYYLGNYHYLGTADNGGVHINSGIQNQWFYLLVNGGHGQREDDKYYTVYGIGFDKATQIAYSNLVNYLFRSATYDDAVELSMLAAAEIFGENSFEQEQVMRAWYAVGFFNEVSITEVQSTNLWTILPNPGSSFFQILHPNSNENSHLTITDISGKVILNTTYTNGSIIDASEFQSGVYFLRIGNTVLKWVKF